MDSKFANTFFSYFDDQIQYNGMNFSIVRELTEEEYDKEDNSTMYLIELENGIQIQAFEEEITTDGYRACPELQHLYNTTHI